MNEQLLHLIKQMSKNEKQMLYKYIKSNYILEERDGMLRDDIRDKVIELLHVDFPFIEDDIQPRDDLGVMNLDREDLVNLSATLIKEFELEDIAFSEIVEWETVSDIITTIDILKGE